MPAAQVLPCDLILAKLHCRSLEELPVAGFSDVLAVLYDNFASRQNRLRYPLYLHALVAIVVHVHVVRLGTESHFLLWIEDNDIGIRSDGDRPFAREQPEDFC